MARGAQSVMTFGLTMMLELPAGQHSINISPLHMTQF